MINIDVIFHLLVVIYHNEIKMISLHVIVNRELLSSYFVSFLCETVKLLLFNQSLYNILQPFLCKLNVYTLYFKDKFVTFF